MGLNINLRVLFPLSFFIFISFIIYLADTANYNFAFSIVKHIPYGDKVMHLLLYGIMALSLNYGLNFKSHKILGFNMQLGAIIVLTFAIIEEGTQYYIPSRSFDLYDILSDIIGVVVFSLV